MPDPIKQFTKRTNRMYLLVQRSTYVLAVVSLALTVLSDSYLGLLHGDWPNAAWDIAFPLAAVGFGWTLGYGYVVRQAKATAVNEGTRRG